MEHRADMATKQRARGYSPPGEVMRLTLAELVVDARRIPVAQQSRLDPDDPEGRLWCAGDTSLVQRKCVAIVGTRKASPEGAVRARRLARELAQHGVVVVSGLAEGIDVNAHEACLDAGGRTIAVIGTPIDKAYPIAHAGLQEDIARDHLLVARVAPGTRVFPSMFPARNKLMAALSDVTVIIEAGATSGTIHQAAECGRLGRWLFLAKSLVDNPAVTWTEGFVRQPNCRVLSQTSDVLEALRTSAA